MSTSVADLRILTGDASDTDEPTMTMFVNAANLVVTEHLGPTTLTTPMKDLITLYLAGHFYVMSIEVGGITYVRAGQSEEKYKSYGYDAHGFMTSRFGQQACTLDNTGTLLILSKKDKVPFQFESYSAQRANTRLKEAP